VQKRLKDTVRFDGESRKGETRVGAATDAFVVESLETANITKRCRKGNRVGGGYSAVLPNNSVCEVMALTTLEKSFEWLLREVSREGGDIRGVCGDG
jgi:hypothetical protein